MINVKSKETDKKGSGLNIVSWNINDHADRIEGPKFDNPDFITILKSYDIFLLQETKGEIKIPNYKCFNRLRKGTRSGGLCTGVSQTIAKYVKCIDTKNFSQDIQAIQIPKNIIRTDRDLTIINVYDSPPNSSFKITQHSKGIDDNTLEDLEHFIAQISNSEILVAGDFNARTGNRNNPASLDSTEVLDQLIEGSFVKDSYPIVNVRYSKDTIINERGKKLLEFASTCNIEILNGFILGDLIGNYTCHRYNGSSVVDYVMATKKLRQMIQYLQVLDLNIFSDHCPLACTLRTSQNNIPFEIPTFESKPLGYRWYTDTNNDKQASSVAYRGAQNSVEILSMINNLKESSCNTPDEVHQINQKLIDILIKSADDSLTKKRKRAKYCNKNAWFDSTCRWEKRKLSSLSKKTSKDPENLKTRRLYYAQRREYRRLTKRKKKEFFLELNQNIEDGKNINWKRFKNLKRTGNTEESLDLFDLRNFYLFFKELYSTKSLQDHKIDSLNKITAETQERADNEEQPSYDILNNEIEYSELNFAIKKLKSGKAVSEDNIMNEFIINSSEKVRSCILQVFNECLKSGIYPWNGTIITPLHKKGDRYDPNNYRAIAVGSNLGKLFSAILLERLIQYKRSVEPDNLSQLGFCKDAQTADHILTLHTCTSKYLNHKKGRLFTCFVDYQKAFDTVCLEALLYKLSQLGVVGNYFNCINYMYSHSKTKIKLLDKLSEAIDVKTGTEQGHPLSPELFKCYLTDLSSQLDSAFGVTVPILDGKRVTHLLWADDLVLTALDKHSLQILINILYDYCIEWGLTVNLSKTAVMVFNKSGKLLKESKTFLFGNINIPTVREYCYLGINFALTGSFRATQEQLKNKGLRAYFSLRKLVDLNGLSTRAVLKLFNALIVPVLSYGCQVWLPFTKLTQELIKHPELQNSTERSSLAKNLARDPIEKVHIKTLKWLLGVNKKASNLACWGDTGRHPLLTGLIKQVINYHNRLVDMTTSGSEALVCRALVEQANQNLPWLSNLKELENRLLPNSNTTTRINLQPMPMNATMMRDSAQNVFEQAWRSEVEAQSKLKFYWQIKTSFQYEPYLDCTNVIKRKAAARLRSSSHRLNIETARYIKYSTKKRVDEYTTAQNYIFEKRCKICTGSGSITNIKLLLELPYNDIIIEDEWHVLLCCPAYQHLRASLSPTLKILLWNDDYKKQLFNTNEEIVNELLSYISNINKIRFPGC